MNKNPGAIISLFRPQSWVKIWDCRIWFWAIGCALTSVYVSAQAQETDGFYGNYRVAATGVASSEDFSPYYIASMRGGTATQGKDAQASAMVWGSYHKKGSRLAFSGECELYGGYANSVDYLRWQPQENIMVENPQHPARVWVQQLYLSGTYRSLFLTVGMKHRDGGLLNPELTSGDLVESGNARPIPQIRAGFSHFVDIPLTRGWVQIQGELSYGKQTDDKWLENHFNYYSGHLNTGAIYCYKRCRFRTNPSQPLSVLVGMQVAVHFGGATARYKKGKYAGTDYYTRDAGDFLKAFIPFFPKSGAHYDGSSLGTWDFLARYRLPDGSQLKAYMEKPYEDGSAIGFRNGWDGLWGLEYEAATPGIVSGAVIEYIDFTNQSGPLHWMPDLMPGTSITSKVGGADDYYNNYQYDSYANYGMAIGSPFIPSPVYFRDGSIIFQNNRIRGFHAAIKGNLSRHINYRLMGGYRKGWGRANVTYKHPTHNASFMAEGTYTKNIPTLPGSSLVVSLQAALDRGTMFGNNFGCCLTVSFNGLL